MPVIYDTGYKYPSSTGFSIPPYGTGNEWADGADAFIEGDELYTAMQASTPFYKYQSYKNFNFGIPPGMSISGMDVEIMWKITKNPNTEPAGFMFYCTSNDNWYQDTSNYISPALEDKKYVYGMSSAPMTRDDFSDANFKMAIFSGGTNDTTIIAVEYIKIKVYYYVPDGIDISVSESISINESLIGSETISLGIIDSIAITEDELRIYDGIAYNRAVSTSQLITEYIPHIEVSWRFRLNGGTPEGKTLRLGN